MQFPDVRSHVHALVGHIVKESVDHVTISQVAVCDHCQESIMVGEKN